MNLPSPESDRNSLQPLTSASIDTSAGIGQSSQLGFEVPAILGGLPVLDLRGTPTEIGTLHGRRFAAEIAECAAVYRMVWSHLSEAQLESFVGQQRDLIEKHFPHYAEEIHAIAGAAGIPVMTAFALNGRTEVTLHQHALEALKGSASSPVPECTLVGSTVTRVMGENWDWAACIEKITTLNHITRPDGHRILTLTEPGIIGKVGMNSAGIGVGLNFIPGTSRNSGIPVHILLRTCLDAGSFEEISDTLENFAAKDMLGTMSAITVMDRHGQAEVFEIIGPELIRTRQMSSPIFAHTNHPVLNPEGYGTTDLDNSLARLHDARELAAREPLTVEALARILADRSNTENSINMTPQSWGAIGDVETIRSLIFDLGKGEFHISRGAPGEMAQATSYDTLRLY